MSEIDQVLSIAKAIEDEGKLPSIALIKARLGQNIPMPELIKGLQTYKALSAEQKQNIQAPIKPKPTTKSSSSMTAEQRLESLEKRVEKLEVENDLLKQQLEQLAQRGNH